MKKNIYRKIFISLFLLLIFTALAKPQQIKVEFRDTTITGGTTFDYPVYIDSTLTGLNVTAYQVEFTYNNLIFSFVEAVTAGTMTSAWDNPNVNIAAPGRIQIANAGTTSLAGTGMLLILRFTAGKFTYTNGGSFSFQNIMFNEGSPAAINDDGYVYITPPPSITVTPNTGLITKGETLQFSAFDGKAPLSWYSTNPSVASINSNGLLTAVSAGFTKVICVDADGIIDTSDNIEIRAFSLSLHDSSFYQTQTIDIPVYITDLTNEGIYSGQFSISYSSGSFTPESLITTNTLLQNTTMAPLSYSDNKINIIFAGSSPLSGSGILLYIRIKPAEAIYGSYYFNFENSIFNETIRCNSTGGYITIRQPSELSISSSGNHIIAGDSLQFFALGGTEPYQWNVSDTSRASINSSGWLKAKKSGNLTVSVKDIFNASGSSLVSIYDFSLSVPDTSIFLADTIDIPLYVTSNTIGFSSFQFNLGYTTGASIELVDIISSGSLTTGWTINKMSTPGGNVSVAAAGTNSIFSGGTLLKLRFIVPASTPVLLMTYINISGIVFNEGVPLALPDDGFFRILEGSIAQPTNLLAVSNEEKKVTLSWQDNSNNELNFHIQRKTGDSLSSNPYAEIAALGENISSYVDTAGLEDLVKYTYRVYASNGANESPFSNQAEVTTIVSIDMTEDSRPKNYKLFQNYPNPFNPETNIKFELPEDALTSIIIYNILGDEITTLVNEQKSAGAYEVNFNASSLANGVYFYVLSAGNFRETKKLILLK